MQKKNRLRDQEVCESKLLFLGIWSIMEVIIQLFTAFMSTSLYSPTAAVVL